METPHISAAISSSSLYVNLQDPQLVQEMCIYFIKQLNLGTDICMDYILQLIKAFAGVTGTLPVTGLDYFPVCIC